MTRPLNKIPSILSSYYSYLPDHHSITETTVSVKSNWAYTNAKNAIPSFIVLRSKEEKERYLERCNQALSIIHDLSKERWNLIQDLLPGFVLAKRIDATWVKDIDQSIKHLQLNYPRHKPAAQDIVMNSTHQPTYYNKRQVFAKYVYPFSKKRNSILTTTYLLEDAIAAGCDCIVSGECSKNVNYIFSENFRNLVNKQNDVLGNVNSKELDQMLS